MLRLSFIFIFIGVQSQILLAQKKTIFSANTLSHSLSERWELDAVNKRSNFVLTPYKPIFISPFRWSSNPNKKPESENPDYSSPIRIPYNAVETKFQLSFKTKIVSGLFNKHGDLWVGYTQRSHWQIYNQALSRPFRETNYEPELILNIATHYKLFGFNGSMLSVAFNHQSNGRALPLSRSWNRIIFQAGFDKKNWMIYVRPWIRIPDKDDENPEITNYIGNADMVVIHNFKNNNQLAITGSNSFNASKNFRGRLQIEWTFPVKGYLNLHAKASEGYGETLIDYNFRQTTLGIGVSLVEW